MNSDIKKLQNDLQDVPDLVIKKIKLNFRHHLFVVYLESLCSQDRINEYLLKRLTNKSKLKDFESEVPGSNIKPIKDYNDIIKYLYDGYTIIYDKNNKYAVETKGDLNRGLSTNETEPTIRGPKNAFIENYQANLGLIKKRIRTPHLKTKNLTIGKISKTPVGILYIDNVAKNENVDLIYDALSKINIDVINSAEELSSYLPHKKSLFPTVIATERPDRCAEALSEGKIVIICENSPVALILPAFLIDFINPFADKYGLTVNTNFTKIIRLACFFLSAIVPAFYIAIINYNQETIPTTLIINFASQRSAVPFPALAESIICLVICEILRESDLRFPTKYGSAISILGALVLGEAAVNAGLVSPIMIIITAFTYVSALIFSEQEIGNALRYYRFFFLFLASIFGLYGLMIGVLFFITNLCDIKSLNYHYSFPIAPFDKSYFKEFFLRSKNYFRSKKLSKNTVKERP